MITWPEMEAFIQKKQENNPQLAKYSPLAIFIVARENIEWRDIIKHTGLKREKVKNAYLWSGYRIPRSILPELPEDGLKPRSFWTEAPVIAPKVEHTVPHNSKRAKNGASRDIILGIVRGAGRWVSARDIMEGTNMSTSTVYANLDRLANRKKIQRKVMPNGGVMWAKM